MAKKHQFKVTKSRAGQSRSRGKATKKAKSSKVKLRRFREMLEARYKTTEHKEREEVYRQAVVREMRARRSKSLRRQTLRAAKKARRLRAVAISDTVPPPGKPAK